MGQVRARATCIEDSVTRSGQSDLFTVPTNGAVTIPEVFFDVAVPIPTALTLSAPTTVLSSVGGTTPLTVTAIYSDGSTGDVTAGTTGTNYTISNPAIATVGTDGLLTAVSSGTVVLSAINDGALGLIRIQVVLSQDTDGDGIADDIELANGLNPNSPTDGLEDPDADGLTNVQELQLGTDIQLADTDGDNLPDGQEVLRPIW
jgi:hypothetical protein